VGSSKDDLRAFPKTVKTEVGFALDQAQNGEKSLHAVPLAGFGSAGVLEIVSNFNKNTYRAVYTVALSEGVFVLHAFQKKSKSGIATPRKEMELVRRRLKAAEAENERLRQAKLLESKHGKSSG